MKTTIMIALGLISVCLAGCGTGGKYGEVKKLMTDYLTMTKNLDKALADGKDAKAVAKALNEYVGQMKSLSPQMEALPKKYPELDKNPPPELAELVDQLKGSEDSFKNIFGKLMEYSSDPDVMAALQKMQEL